MIFGRVGWVGVPSFDIVKSGVDSCYGGLRFAQEMTGRFWAKVMGRKLNILDTGWRCFLG